jgi:plastocyanin
MRSGLAVLNIAVVGVLAVLVFASDGAAGLKYLTVALTASGPSPSTLTRDAFNGEQLTFVNQDSVAHTVVFAKGHCSFTVVPGGSGGCHDAGPNRTGTYPYTVDGKSPGTVHVVGLFRSVTVTARTHTIRLGRGIELHGEITIANQGSPFCAPAFGQALLVLARHARTQPVKRIAVFSAAGRRPHSKRAVNDRCSYSWQRLVRPGLSTTYMVKTFGGLSVWRSATSRPFAVLVRH